MDSKAAEEFRKVVKGVNIITPDILDYCQGNNYIIELSAGEFLGDRLWGVTVVKDGRHDRELSEVFRSEEEALEYIRELVGGEE